MSAKAYAISDFWHGPMAMVEKNMPIIVFSSNDAAKKDTAVIVRQLREMEADILMITDSVEMAEYGDAVIYVPQGEPLVEPFYHVAAAQLFSYGLAIHKGQNPDQPRNLQKITITR